MILRQALLTAAIAAGTFSFLLAKINKSEVKNTPSCTHCGMSVEYDTYLETKTIEQA